MTEPADTESFFFSDFNAHVLIHTIVKDDGTRKMACDDLLMALTGCTRPQAAITLAVANGKHRNVMDRALADTHRFAGIEPRDTYVCSADEALVLVDCLPLPHKDKMKTCILREFAGAPTEPQHELVRRAQEFGVALEAHQREFTAGMQAVTDAIIIMRDLGGSNSDFADVLKTRVKNLYSHFFHSVDNARALALGNSATNVARKSQTVDIRQLAIGLGFKPTPKNIIALHARCCDEYFARYGAAPPKTVCYADDGTPFLANEFTADAAAWINPEIVAYFNRASSHR